MKHGRGTGSTYSVQAVGQRALFLFVSLSLSLFLFLFLSLSLSLSLFMSFYPCPSGSAGPLRFVYTALPRQRAAPQPSPFSRCFQCFLYLYVIFPAITSKFSLIILCPAAGSLMQQALRITLFICIFMMEK